MILVKNDFSESSNIVQYTFVKSVFLMWKCLFFDGMTGNSCFFCVNILYLWPIKHKYAFSLFLKGNSACMLSLNFTLKHRLLYRKMQVSSL